MATWQSQNECADCTKVLHAAARCDNANGIAMPRMGVTLRQSEGHHVADATASMAQPACIRGRFSFLYITFDITGVRTIWFVSFAVFFAVRLHLDEATSRASTMYTMGIIELH